MSQMRIIAGLTAVSAAIYAVSSEGDRQKNLKANEATQNSTGGAPQQAKPVKKEITSEEFNRSQDQESIKKCLTALEIRHKSLAAGKIPTNDNDICTVELFRFLSCPYCAKVKGVLDYNKVPYRTVTADPITYAHMPQTPYSMAPQIQFVTNPSAPVGSPSRGPFVVDSDQIVATLSDPLGYRKQLDDTRVQETLKFVSNAYSRGTFVAMYSNLNRAMEAYRHCVPDHYQYLPLRVAGSIGMSFIASKKAFPKIKDHFPMSDGETIDSVVERQTQWFAERIPSNKPFHGGDKPDIADIQMYAMSQSVLSNPLAAPIINKANTPFGEWVAKMATLMPNGSIANYGCEVPRI